MLFNKLKRLASMGAEEMSSRLKQEFAKKLDGLGLFLPSFKSLPVANLAHTGRFFFDREDIPQRIRLIREHIPCFEENILDQAEQILNHRFSLLGYETLDYGRDIDWQLDIVNGKRAPLKPWPKIGYLDFHQVGDSKVTWELSRHQFLPTLAKAWLLTGDKRYVRKLEDIYYDWQKKNPYPLGVNWASSLEVAFRSLSWIWTVQLLGGCESAVKLRQGIMCALAFNAWYIRRYLSTYFSPNTHLQGEAVALYFIGTLFPSLPNAKDWRETGWNVLLEHALTKVLEDGAYFEQSTYYHVYALDFFLHARILAERNGKPFPGSYDAVMQKMVQHLACLCQAGPPPRFGDDDGGRVFDGRRNQARHLSDPLAIGAALYRRGDFKQPGVQATEEMVWLLGEEGLSAFYKTPCKIDSVSAPPSYHNALEISRHSGMDRRNPDCRDATNPYHPWSLGSGDPCRNDGENLNSTVLPPYPPLQRGAGGICAESVCGKSARFDDTGLYILLVPKLQLGNAALEAPASGVNSSWSLQGKGSQAGAWEPAHSSLQEGGEELRSQLVFDAGPLGGGSGGHGHADALSLTLNLDGKPVLVDPGACNYVGPGSDREVFRVTQAHNTVTVDGLSQAIPKTAFSWFQWPKVSVETVVFTPEFEFIVASHDGYTGLQSPVTHRRTVFSPHANFWFVLDELLSDGPHDYALHWHLAPGSNVEQHTSGWGIDLAGSKLHIITAADGWHTAVEPSWFSPAYGAKQAAPVIRYRKTRAVGGQAIATVLWAEDLGDFRECSPPFAKGGEPCESFAESALGTPVPILTALNCSPTHRAYRLTNGAMHSIFTFGDGVSTNQIDGWETDARFLYGTLDADGQPLEAVLVQATFLRYCGETLRESTEKLAHFVWHPMVIGRPHGDCQF